MILCPICEKPVVVPPTLSEMCSKLVRDPPVVREVNLEDGSSGDFCCNTYVEVHPSIRWCHYTRFTRHFIDKPSRTIMQAIIPPFEVLWCIDEMDLKVDEFHTFNSKTCRFDWRTVCQTDGDFQDFLRAIERFKNLKAFA